MPIESSENFTGRTMTKTADGKWTAVRVWLVTGARNEGEVFSANAMSGTPPIDGIGNSHPQSDLLKVDNHNITQTGPQSWTIAANYLVDPGEAGANANDTAKLQLLPTVSWGKGMLSLPTDVTIAQKPVVNANGDPYNPAPTRAVAERHFRITRYEPFYDIQRARQFEDHVNSADLQLGPVVVLKQECLCAQIIPIEDYSIGAKVVKMAYDFVLRIDNRVGSGTSYPFQTHLINKGRRGYYSDSGTKFGEFFYADGTQVSDDILLSTTGIPLDSTIKVSTGLKTPIANPNLSGLALVQSPLSTAKQIVFRYDEVPEADFTLMGFTLANFSST